jgi:predicted O-linked N-acetylglucosamine transferase (SPINDLY family)
MSKQKSRAAAWKKQARMMVSKNRLKEGRDLYLKVCDSTPDDREAWVELAGVSRRLGALREAEQASRHVLSRYPDDPDALHALGAALHRQRRLDEAIACYQQTLQHKPDNPETRYFLANALRELGRLDEAAAEYARTLDLEPDHLHALNNLSALLTNQGKIEQAAKLLGRGLAISPHVPQLLINFGRMSLHAGQAQAAVEAFRTVIDLQPDLADAHSNLLACLNYLPDQDPGQVLAEHRRWNARHTTAIQPFRRWHNLPDPQRRLRIGYVSPDLREHSVARFLEPVFESLDADRFETLCYADVLHPDTVTARLRGLSSGWVDAGGLTHEQLARRIYEDRVDILVDLAGHTANNRLPVFARKPAPVQVSWLGYPNTTGLASMDYRLTDARADPTGMTEAFHTETLLRLPDSFLCYKYPENAPPVGSLPAGAAGDITFGSFNNLAKTTPHVIHAWSRILQAVPGSRLLLKSSATGDTDIRRRLVAQFATLGAGEDRIAFLDPAPDHADHMAAYSQVDIALDTFPYNGTTTTCEALWMGVPVVCVAGRVHAARVGVSLLTQVGLENLIAPDEDGYIQTAVRLAQDREALAAIRLRLRDTLRDSTLCDAGGFARALEQAMHEMWSDWCCTQTSL